MRIYLGPLGQKYYPQETPIGLELNEGFPFYGTSWNVQAKWRGQNFDKMNILSIIDQKAHSRMIFHKWIMERTQAFLYFLLNFSQPAELKKKLFIFP